MTTLNDMLQQVLKELEQDLLTKEVAIISSDGLLIAGRIKQSSRIDLFCAMIALITRTSTKVSGELSAGKLDKIYLKLHDGAIIASEVSSGAIIAVMTTEGENIGLISNRIDKAKEKIRKILE